MEHTMTLHLLCAALVDGPIEYFFHDTPLKIIPKYDAKYILKCGLTVMIWAGNEINVVGLNRLHMPGGK